MILFDNFLNPQTSPLKDNQTMPIDDLCLNASTTNTALSSLNTAWPTTRLGSIIIKNNMRMRDVENLLARTAAVVQEESVRAERQSTLRMSLSQEREQVQNAEAALVCQQAKAALAQGCRTTGSFDQEL